MTEFRPSHLARAVAAACFVAGAATAAAPTQQLDLDALIHGVDAAVKARIDDMAGYSVTEHYAVYRNSDETHPAAEMTVRTVYRQDTGKSYTPISQSGSGFLRSTVIGSILENEKRLNQPGNREGAWITSANYEMKLQPIGNQSLDGRDCIVLALTPKRESPYLFNGTLWVDSKDYSIVQLQGTASKSASFLTGPAYITRQYANVDGFPMATHLMAVSNSMLLGRTMVKIDYRDYQIQIRSAP
jgi:outer membrane lipoprotein-sorting protein